ncbi:MAG: hypothetical protein V4465_03170 [Patescibacteria group bacterium]
MDIHKMLGVLSGLMLLYAFYPYLKAIVRGETSPRKATWLVWAAGDTIALAGQIAQHKVSGLLVGAVIGASATFFLSLWHGEKGWNGRDRICLMLSGFAIATWMYFGESNIGIALSLVALLIAAWPTYVSAWYRPENESKKGWIIFNLSSLIGVLAIPHWTFGDAAPAIVFLIIDVPMLYLLFIRPRSLLRKI